MQKRALGYVRISKKDQSNFSIEGQEEYIRKHCERQGWQLIATSVDEGQSAANFDRANWRELETYIRKNHREVDYLVVAKFDRFSRNVTDALTMMDKLERRYGIRVMSVMEPIALHPDSPYFFQFRTQMLVGAQVELMVIRDRTKFGLVSAARSGRYIGKAPFGYVNTRGNDKKPALELDPLKAPLVAKVYELFLQGMSMAEIRRLLGPEGLKLKGNSAMQRLLTQPIYAGLVHVPAYYDEPEQLADGKHTAIVPKAQWWQAQAMLESKEGPRIIYNLEVPLRGVLHCQCGRLMTAGNSKGKTRHYWYYKCNTHKEHNHSAGRLHAQFTRILQELSIPGHLVSAIADSYAKKLEVLQANRTEQVQGLKKEYSNVSAQLERLEEKFLCDEIDKATFQKWQSRWEAERGSLASRIAEARQPLDQAWARYKENLNYLSDLAYLYEIASVHQKQAFIRLVFNSGLAYSDGCYRTPYILPFFSAKAAWLQQKRLLVIEQPEAKSGKIPVSSGDGS